MNPQALVAPTQSFPCARAILFTGHRIDAPGRAIPRFPACAESAVRAAIRCSLSGLITHQPDRSVGVAGGACGGDILFHEVCAELGVPTRMLLALPPASYIQSSVAQGGMEWIARFDALVQRLGPDNVRILTGPVAQSESATGNLWEEANHRMIQMALDLAPERVLLALWDGKAGDGPGGAEHLIRSAARCDIRIAPVISPQSLVW